MTIYIVTRGDHAMNDFEIIAVRSSKDAADALAKQVDGYVRPWEVDGELPVSEPWGWSVWIAAAVLILAAATAIFVKCAYRT